MESSVNSRLAGPGYGAFVISLDFELHWGVRDHEPLDGPYRPNLLGARNAIPRLLEMFERYGISATWAIVGFLFARSREERRKRRSAALCAEPYRPDTALPATRNRHAYLFASLLPGTWANSRQFQGRS